MTDEAFARAGLAALAVGIAVRLGFWSVQDGMYYPDEVFQYLEPAHARITGSGWLPWEYEVGARNWALPGLWGGMLEILRAVGLRGLELHRALMLVSAVSSALIVPAGLRLGRALTSDRRAGVVLAFLFACFPLFGFFAPHTLSENPALIFTVWGYALYFDLDAEERSDSWRRPVAIGLLLGAAVISRTAFLVFVPAPLVHLFVCRRERELVRILAGLGIAALALGALDALTWGRPFQSVVELARATRAFEAQLSAQRLGEPVTFYVTEVLGGRVGVFGVALALLATPFAGRRGLPLATFWLVPLVALSALEHKQERFVIGVLPLLLANAVQGAHFAARRWNAMKAREGLLAAALAIALCVSALPGTLAMPHRAHAGAFQALSWIGTREDASGVLVDRGENANGGYLLLERSIPLAPFDPALARHRLFNYVVADTPALVQTMRAHEGFRQGPSFEGAVVFRRSSFDRPADGSARSPCGDAAVTTCSLLREMESLEALTRWPDPPFEAHQASSRDPASDDPEEPDWFSNDDRGHYRGVHESSGRRELVMMEAEGPGAVVRIWSANPAGTLRIYVDGHPEPVIEGEMAALLRGDVAPFVAPYAHVTAGGHNLYWPIVFASGVRVTTDAPDLYYHVQWRAYAAATDVESTSAALLRGLRDRPSRTTRETSADAITQTERVRVEPGETRTIAIAAEEPQAIRSIQIRPALANETVLRETELGLSFDGVETARVPLGDFFGSGPGLNPYASFVADVRPDGSMRARWWMPFRRNASVALHNTGAVPVTLEVRLERGAYRWSDASMYFHASWRSSGPIESGPPRDWTLGQASGRGRYVGTVLNVSNPVEAWWGEGDEKIWIDGEDHARFFGTGTEDYFGYAWQSAERYVHRFHSQTRADGPANAGRSSNNRWHVIDSIPFQSSLRFDLEVLTWQPTTLTLDAVAYWYAVRPAE